MSLPDLLRKNRIILGIYLYIYIIHLYTCSYKYLFIRTSIGDRIPILSANTQIAWSFLNNYC